MKTVVISPFYPISDKLDTSHRAGWARYWANELKNQGDIDVDLLTTARMGEVANLRRGDRIHCYHGMEFKGQMNLQSGLTDEILNRVKLLIDAAKRGVRISSLDVPMPDYGRLLAERGMDPTSAEALTKACGKAQPALCPNNQPKHVAIGDSHMLSLYRPDTTVLRNDSLTLYGALRRGGSWGGLLMDVNILEHEWGVELDKLDSMTFYYGNIDIRHHLLRQETPATSMKEIVKDYGAQIELIAKDKKPKAVEIVLPLPIEDEARAIPKSGWYKGTPFFGTWSERHQMRLAMRDQMKRMAKKYGFETYDHPKHFVDKDGKLSFDAMERPRSVHIRPSEYRLVQEGQKWLV